MPVIKYYGTNIIKYFSLLENPCNSHHQHRIVCKAKSRAEANRIAESLGLGRNVFQSNCTCETGNSLEISLCDKYGFIICLSGTMSNEFGDIKDYL